MSSWALSNPESTSHLIGCAVQDALGVRLGHVSGWVSDPDGTIQLMKVSVTEWNGESEYLVPIGAVTLVSERRSLVQLRDVTKQSVGRLCYRFKGEMPDPRLLVRLQRHFPAPRVSVVERLVHPPARPAAPRWTHLDDMSMPDPPRRSQDGPSEP